MQDTEQWDHWKRRIWFKSRVSVCTVQNSIIYMYVVVEVGFRTTFPYHRKLDLGPRFLIIGPQSVIWQQDGWMHQHGVGTHVNWTHLRFKIRQHRYIYNKIQGVKAYQLLRDNLTVFRHFNKKISGNSQIKMSTSIRTSIG